MTDIELLKLAAKAAGYKYTGEIWEGSLVCLGEAQVGGRGIKVEKIEQGVTTLLTGEFLFNPLESDGDALRLAADLRLVIKPGKCEGDGCTVDNQREGIPGCTAFYGDKYKQMRQAIVRAAAEIGKGMK